MTPQLKNLLILLGGIAVVLIIVIVLFSGKSTFRRLIGAFINEDGAEDIDDIMMSKQKNTERAKSEPKEKMQSGPIVEMATLIRKSDDRMRIIESTGQVKIVDAYYELVFVTRKGKQVTIECSAEAYDKIPFNQQGSLTYKKNVLVKFKYYEDTVFN